MFCHVQKSGHNIGQSFCKPVHRGVNLGNRFVILGNDGADLGNHFFALPFIIEVYKMSMFVWEITIQYWEMARH